MAMDVPLDEHYLKDVYIPSVRDQGTRIELSNDVSQLEEHLKEYRTFMKQVEAGQIPITKSMKGGWGSFLETKDWFFNTVFYSDSGDAGNSFGPLSSFSKYRQNQNSAAYMYGFSFYKNGYLRDADAPGYWFMFDEQGKVQMHCLMPTNSAQSGCR